MEAGAATAGGIGRAETRERAGDKSCCKQVFHVFSLHRAAGRRIVIMVQVQFDTLNICDVEWLREPNHGDLNAE
jgi:hypothetical protein